MTVITNAILPYKTTHIISRDTQLLEQLPGIDDSIIVMLRYDCTIVTSSNYVCIIFILSSNPH